MLRTRPYIFWLQENASEPPRKQEQEVGPYERHRRLIAFDVNTDQSALAGYSWRNPLTNHNYGYQLRVDIKMLEDSDKAYKIAAWTGVAYISLSGLYLYLRSGWKLALVPIAMAALNTEIISAAQNSAFRKSFPTLQKVQEEIQKQYDNGNLQAKQLVDRWHYGDVEYAAGRIWNANLPKAEGGDGLGQLQGSSIVSAAGGGACFHRLFFDGGYKQSWGMIFLGVLGSLSTVDNLLTFFNIGQELQAGGERVAHEFHLLGQMTGVFWSWLLKYWFKI